MLRYMLDSNVCIYLMREEISPLRGKFNRLVNQLCISTVTYMELSYGAEYSRTGVRNRQALADLTAPLAVLDYDREAAAHTGDIRAGLRRKGKPIGPYDVMIAGHARSKGLAVVTNNLSEFARVPGLEAEDWL